MTQDDYAPAAHYDRVTEAWGLLLGPELHYGVFETGEEDLVAATNRLTTVMIEAARLDGATFEVRDGTDNGLPDASFDLAWVMESSHLMAHRDRLVSECARVLRPGGRLVLCDIIRRRELPFLEVRERREEFAVLRAAFGAARMDPLTDYEQHAVAAGLVPDQSVDLTAETLPTFDRWQANLDDHRAEVTRLLGDEGTATFERSLSILRDFWRDGTLGYGLFSADKPQ